VNWPSRTEMWQKLTEHAAGSVCYRNALIITKSVLKVFLLVNVAKKSQTRRVSLKHDRTVKMVSLPVPSVSEKHRQTDSGNSMLYDNNYTQNLHIKAQT